MADCAHKGAAVAKPAETHKIRATAIITRPIKIPVKCLPITQEMVGRECLCGRTSNQGLRRTAQMNADTLLISAAMAISREGSRTKRTAGDSMPELFPICSLRAIGKNLSR